MRRLKLTIALTISALMAAVGFTAAPAYAAYPTSTFYADYHKDAYVWGKTTGAFTWYNQSVGVQGEVCDYGYPAGTTAKFTFFDSNYNPVGSTQSRYVNDACRSFNWTQDGSYGGIRYVDITMCWGDDCRWIDTWARKY